MINADLNTELRNWANRTVKDTRAAVKGNKIPLLIVNRFQALYSQFCAVFIFIMTTSHFLDCRVPANLVSKASKLA